MRPSVRFEIKYRVPPGVAEDLAAHLARYMQPDEHGEGGGASYPVHSLYLDAPSFSIYRETAEDAYSRYKLRARCYDFAPGRKFFLEVKSRSGEAMTKTRAAASFEETRQILSGAGSDRSDPALAAFMAARDGRRARPVAWITYDRAAYVGGERSLVRITFDSEVKAALPTPDLSEPARWYVLPEVVGLVVVEVKYTGSYPAWVAETVRRFGIHRSSMSKYRQGIDALIAADLLPALRAA